MAKRILLVEDDEELGKQIVTYLEEAGYETRWIRDGSEALRQSPESYHLVVLDLMLPGANGIEILGRFRKNSGLPILILSARNETIDKVRALELGADDFVTKPFWPEELMARIQARLRRPDLLNSGTVQLGGLSIDVNARRVRVDGIPVELTRVEFDLIAALAKRPGAAISRRWLVENCLDPDREGCERTLDVHVSRLRKKLGACSKSVATVWGVGYRLESQAAR